MRVKSVVSVLAMAAAMAAAPAFAQDAAASYTIRGTEIGEADRAAVQAACDALLADEGSTVESATDTSSSVTTDTETGSDDTDSEAVNTSSNDSPPAEGLNATGPGGLDLDAITIDECNEGGWTPAGSVQ